MSRLPKLFVVPVILLVVMALVAYYLIGLKLTARKLDRKVVVVDRAERTPSEN